MGDLAVANDLIAGVKDALAVVGDTATFRIENVGTIDPNDPGADPGTTPEDVSLEAFLFDFDNTYFPDANIEQGSTMAILDLSELTEPQIDEIKIGNKLTGIGVEYTITNTNKIQVAGKTVTFILQLN